MRDALKEIKKQFPAATIIENGVDIEFFFDDDGLTIKTPDRSKAAHVAVKRLKTSGLSGVWRSRTLKSDNSNQD